MLLLDTHRAHASPGQLIPSRSKGSSSFPTNRASRHPALGVGSAMVPPRWPGEPTHDCPRCGRIVGPLHMRTEHLRHAGWEPYQVVSYVNWCGHAQEIIPLPLPDGRVTFVPVLGEAR